MKLESAVEKMVDLLSCKHPFVEFVTTHSGSFKDGVLTVRTHEAKGVCTVCHQDVTRLVVSLDNQSVKEDL